MKIKYIAVLFFAALFCSCNIDVKGFFYSYSTPDERFEQSRTLPSPASISPATQDFSLVFTADPHFTRESGINFDSFINGISDLAPSDIIGMAVLGDLVQNGQEAEYLSYHESVDGLNVFNVIGNHDVYNAGWNFFREYLGPSSYSLPIGTAGEIGSLLLINIDSANASLGNSQTEWLINILETERKQYTHCIIITHSNLFPSSLGTVVQFSDKNEVYSLVDLFNKHDVDYVLGGHSHQLSEYELFSTKYITLDSIKEPDSHFMIMTVSPEGLMHEIYPVTAAGTR